MSLTALQLANQRLQAIRKQQGVKVACETVDPTVPPTTSKPKIMAINETMAELPAHLGIGSASLTAHLRRIVPDVFQVPEPTAVTLAPVPAPEIAPIPTLKIYPTVLATAIGQKLYSPLRLWLICKTLEGGRGWLDTSELKQAITANGRYTWRRARQILNQGHGVWWHWDKTNGRLWLRSVQKVADTLGIERLSGMPVYLPHSVIWNDDLKKFNAEGFASFFSGRKSSAPISQYALTEITGIHERSQRNYRKTAHIAHKENYAISRSYEQENHRKRAYEQFNGAVFTFIDYRGHQGKRGEQYTAFKLPNSYQHSQQIAPRGMQRRINKNLLKLGRREKCVTRVFHEDGAKCAKAYNRDHDNDHFWPISQRKKREDLQLWSCMPKLNLYFS